MRERHVFANGHPKDQSLRLAIFRDERESGRNSVVRRANVHDATVMAELLHGEEQALVGDSAYGNMTLKAHCRQAGLLYLITDKAAKSVKLSGKQDHANRHKSSVRAKVEFPFRIIKQLWGHTKVRYRGLAKNTARLHFLFALSNLFQARRALLAAV